MLKKVKHKMNLIYKKKRNSCMNNLKYKKLVSYLRKEFETSTTHGLPYIVNTEIHWFERFFWAVSFVLCTAIIFVLLSAQYTRFVEAPIVTSVEMDYFTWNVSYPAIILCPTYKIDDDILSAFVNDSLDRTGEDLTTYLKTIMSVSMESIHLIQPPAPDILPLLDPRDYVRIASELFKEFGNNTLSTIVNWPISIEPVMTEMGMCHVINSNVAVFDNPAKWSDTEVTYSKRNIELSFHDRDFFIQIMNYADDYKIYTNSPDDIFFYGTPSLTFDSEGFLSFGVQISSTRASEDIRIIPINLRKCRFIDESNSKRYSIYSYNRCLLECRIQLIMKLCECIPHFYKPIGSERICNIAELACVLKYKKEIMTLSVANATMDKFDNIEGLPRSTRDCGCLDSCEANVYKNDRETFLPQQALNRLRIEVSSFPRVRVVREIIFSFYDIVLRSGGVVNLCIGTSVISIMELLLTAIRIPIYEIAQIVQIAYQRKKEASKAQAWSKSDKIKKNKCYNKVK